MVQPHAVATNYLVVLMVGHVAQARASVPGGLVGLAVGSVAQAHASARDGLVVLTAGSVAQASRSESSILRPSASVPCSPYRQTPHRRHFLDYF